MVNASMLESVEVLRENKYFIQFNKEEAVER